MTLSSISAYEIPNFGNDLDRIIIFNFLNFNVDSQTKS